MRVFSPCHDGFLPPTQEVVLTGLAKIAASSPRVRSKRHADYFRLPIRSLLNRCDSSRVPFLWTINPYRGCELGCKYCYARYTHEYLGFDDPSTFGEKIYVKQRASEILRGELSRDPGGAIAIGTATDPYQPAERSFKVTREILTTLAEFRGLDLSITTKSDLILRDTDLLLEICRENRLQVNMTITTLRPELARCLEPLAPRPDLRLEAVRSLAEAGIAIAVFAMPVMPGLTDEPGALEALACAAADARACYFAVSPLFLMPSAKKVFFPFLEASFPHLVPRYRQLYARNAYPVRSYSRTLAELAERLRRKYGLRGSRQERNLAFGHSRQIPLPFASVSG